MFNNANPEAAGAKKVTWYLTPQFDKVYSFLEDMAAVQKDGKWGFINRAGKIVIKPQFDETYGFNEGLAPAKKGNKWGFIINPLSVQKQEQSLASAGLYIGDIKSVSKTELMVGGKDIAVRVVMGDKLCLYSADKLIILRAVFPMMTLAKCEVISGNRNGVKPGMKVYKYTGGKRQQ